MAPAAKKTTPSKPSPASAPPNATTLDEHVDRPSTTAPGDGPADTTDPSEHASSATPDFATAAAHGHDTVNAVVPVKRAARKTAAAKTEHRIEHYKARKPDGTEVEVEHNIDTGETKLIG
jgi:hypothetical protein